jgi:RNA polymerase sigma-70 factor (ECF subfamily)
MNPSEIEWIYTEYSGKVMGYIRGKVRSSADAEDLCSDVFEKIFTRFDQYDKTKSSISTWVFTITRNTLIDHFRRNKPQEELDENLSDDSEIDEGLLQTESLEELAAALRRMPDELRDLIVLRYYDNKPLTEVAELMGLSYGAVKLRHQKALAMLKKALGA